MRHSEKRETETEGISHANARRHIRIREIERVQAVHIRERKRLVHSASLQRPRPESLERAPNDFPDDLLSVATSSLDLSASLSGQ